MPVIANLEITMVEMEALVVQEVLGEVVVIREVFTITAVDLATMVERMEVQVEVDMGDLEVPVEVV
jgi:hypothetical protein